MRLCLSESLSGRSICFVGGLLTALRRTTKTLYCQRGILDLAIYKEKCDDGSLAYPVTLALTCSNVKFRTFPTGSNSRFQNMDMIATELGFMNTTYASHFTSRIIPSDEPKTIRSCLSSILPVHRKRIYPSRVCSESMTRFYSIRLGEQSSFL